MYMRAYISLLFGSPFDKNYCSYDESMRLKEWLNHVMDICVYIVSLYIKEWKEIKYLLMIEWMDVRYKMFKKGYLWEYYTNKG